MTPGLTTTLFYVVVTLSTAFGQAPQLINFQASLADAGGFSPETSVTFQIYDAPTDGQLLWEEVQVVDPTDGSFNVLLGSVTPLNGLFAGVGDRYLDLIVEETALSERYRLTSVSYALRAEGADGSPGRFFANGSVFAGSDGNLLPAESGRGVRVFLDTLHPAGTIGSIFAFDYGAFEPIDLLLQQPGANVGVARFPRFPWSQLSVRGGAGGAFEVLKLPPDENEVLMGDWFGGEAWPQVRYGKADTSAFFDLGVNRDGNFVVEGTDIAHLVVTQDGRIGIGAPIPDNILTVRQNSETDPIADAWTTYSSRRWKTNIEPIGGALEKVMQLRGVSYDWTESGKHDIGLIAEEVGAVVPEVVAYEENGVDARSVDYPRLVALLIQAVKEQQAMIEDQRESIVQLRAELSANPTANESAP